MANKPPIAAQSTKGPIHAVPCPNCGKTNNFSELDHTLTESDQSLGQDDPGGGNKYSCDHCAGLMRVVAVQRVTFLTVRQSK